MTERESQSDGSDQALTVEQAAARRKRTVLTVVILAIVAIAFYASVYVGADLLR